MVIPSFNHGGTNRSFANIIDLFDFSSHQLNLNILCIKSKKEGYYYSEFLKRGANILKSNTTLLSIFGKNRVLNKIMAVIPYRIKDFFIKKACKKYSNKYDIVISMEEGIATRVASFIDAPLKVAWVRSIFNKDVPQKEYIIEYYSRYNQIVCVSDYCKKAFLDTFSQFKKNTIVIRNTQNRESIVKKAKEKSAVALQKEFFNIVSIGRLDEVKQFSLIPSIAKELSSLVRWYIVGDGSEKDNIYQAIIDNQVEDKVFLTGQINNPYPIIFNADLVAITSRSESFCNVIAEAEILDTNVISTPFPASYDTMQNKDKGVICPLSDFACAIENIISNNKKNDKQLLQTNKEDKNIQQFVLKLENILCHC